MRDLKEIRKDIDKIDNQLIELFKQRMDCARDVGIYKQANNIPVLNEGRENEILDAVEEKGGEYGASARLLYSNIMELSRALQHNIVGSGKELKSVINNASTDIPSSGIKVAYQGIKGANGHEEACAPEASSQKTRVRCKTTRRVGSSSSSYSWRSSSWMAP